MSVTENSDKPDGKGNQVDGDFIGRVERIPWFWWPGLRVLR